MSVGIAEMNPHIKREDAVSDPRTWSVKYRVNPKDKDKPFLFEREITLNNLGIKTTVPHLYLTDIYGSLKRLKDLYEIVRKPRQARISEFLVNASCYLCDTKRGLSILYILQDEATGKNFVKKRIDESINNSPYLCSLIVEGGQSGRGRKKEIDSLSLKKFRDAWFYMLHSNSKTASRSPDSDGVIFDEYDAHNKTNETSFRSTMDNSDLQFLIYVSTPTLPDFGIDLKFKSTSMGTWTVNCANCLEDFIMDSVYFFGDGVRKFNEPRWYDGAIRIFVCPHCGEEIKPLDKQIRGRYFHAVPELIKENRIGYSFSNLILPHVTADKAWGQYRECLLEPGGRTTYVNEKLGEACVDEDARMHFTREIVTDCIDKQLGWVDSAHNTYIGVDWGKETHVTVWKPVDRGLQLLNIFVFPVDKKPLWGAEKVVELIPKFNPSIMVCDFGAGQEQNKYVSERAKEMFYAAVNSPSLKDTNPRWIDKTKIVNYELITTYSTYASWYAAKMIVLPQYDTKLEVFIQHHLNTIILDPNKRQVVEKETDYIRPVEDTLRKVLGRRGPIHFVSSAIYGWLKCMGKSTNEFSFSELPEDFKKKETSRFTMFSTGDVLRTGRDERTKVWAP